MNYLSELKNVFNTMWNKRIETMLRERRNSPRKPCDVHGVYTYQEKSTVPLIIKDIGLSGMQVQSCRKLIPGTYLLVSAHGDSRVLNKSGYQSGDVYMTVLWCRKDDEDYACGLQYNETLEKLNRSWVASLLKKYGIYGQDARYKRRSMRVPAELPMTWRILGGEREHSGTVLDVSLDGVLIAVKRDLPARENLWIRIGPYKSLKPLICRASVIHTVVSRPREQWLAGVCFNGLDEDGTKVLRSYLVDLFLIKN